MNRPVVSDHALIRFLERVGGLDVEAVRTVLAASLARAAQSAFALRQGAYTVKADGMVYVVVDNKLVTIMADDGGPHVARDTRSAKAG